MGFLCTVSSDTFSGCGRWMGKANKDCDFMAGASEGNSGAPSVMIGQAKDRRGASGKNSLQLRRTFQE